MIMWLDNPTDSMESSLWWRLGRGKLSYCHLGAVIKGNPCYYSVVPLKDVNYHGSDKWQEISLPTLPLLQVEIVNA